MTAAPTGQIKDGPSGDLLLRLYRTIHAYVPYFLDLFRDARKRKKEKKKKAAVPSSFVVNHFARSQAGFALPLSPLSLPCIAWRMYAPKCTMRSEAKEEQIFDF